VPSLRESLYLRTFSAHAVLSVAATQTPIIFLGVGEHLTDLDKFSPQPFISKLLGLGDVQGLMEHMQDMAQANPDKQKEMAKKLEEGKLSLRDYREQIQNVMSMQVVVSPWHERSILNYSTGDPSARSHR
jgi:signal recognition particle GTPase